MFGENMEAIHFMERRDPILILKKRKEEKTSLGSLLFEMKRERRLCKVAGRRFICSWYPIFVVFDERRYKP